MKMTDKFKQIVSMYGPGDFDDLEAKYIEGYIAKAVKDIHLMWDEIQRLRVQIKEYLSVYDGTEAKRLRHHLSRIHYLVQYSMLPEEDCLDGVKPSHSNEDIISMVDKEVSEARGTEDA